MDLDGWIEGLRDTAVALGACVWALWGVVYLDGAGGNLLLVDMLWVGVLVHGIEATEELCFSRGTFLRRTLGYLTQVGLTVGVLVRAVALVKWLFLRYVNTTKLLPFWESLLDFLSHPFVLLILALMLVLALGLVLLLLFKNKDEVPRPWFPEPSAPSDPWLLVAAVAVALMLVLLPVPPTIFALVLLSGGAGAIGCLAAFWLLLWFDLRPTRTEIDSHSSQIHIQRVRQSEYISRVQRNQARQRG